jgi:uncharacterized membrane protein YedE/YeeE
MLELLRQPWPWYIAGPVLGLMVPALLLLGNRHFGVSSNLRHMCSLTLPRRADYFRYDVRRYGLWNLAFGFGILIGGFIAGWLLANPEPVQISARTHAVLQSWGIRDFSGLVPAELFSTAALLTPGGLLLLAGGGLCVGFGTAYAGGCTSGHGIAGLAARQLPSLIAVVAFFAGGLVASWVLLPLIIGAGG